MQCKFGFLKTKEIIGGCLRGQPLNSNSEQIDVLRRVSLERDSNLKIIEKPNISSSQTNSDELDCWGAVLEIVW